MTKADLIAAVADRLLETRRTVTPIIEEIFDSIKGALAKGEKCTFVGFGVFEVRNRAAREGRNPRAPEMIVKIPAKKAPIFRPGKGLKARVLAKKK